jgi:hypothetical protein
MRPSKAKSAEAQPEVICEMSGGIYAILFLLMFVLLMGVTAIIG